MQFTTNQLWSRFQKYYSEFPSIGMAIDISRVNFDEAFLKNMAPRMEGAFRAMEELEKGAIANPDEKRMVGHYWLRNPALAPTQEIRREIEEALAAIKSFATKVHQGQVRGAKGVFKNLLVVGIGGSALGPQFVACALGHAKQDKLRVYFFDNTDPDGFDKTLANLEGQLAQTLCVVISKSGGTKETRNGMLEAKFAYQSDGLSFADHAIAVTGKDSELDRVAKTERWIARFPMWDWVGGRTSELSAVGLLPAALQGIDIDGMLAGARACDDVTRCREVTKNPAAQLSLMWYFVGQGRGLKDMVVLPYKDRLELFSRYLQQLMMESLGKEFDLNGGQVNQGIAVYGNKGSTDQHAYVQQLRDGLNNFFCVFIEVHKDRSGPSGFVESNVTSGDFLLGFLLGTREALHEKSRESITITMSSTTAQSVGALIALFERAVGFYASLININAYHQPGVEAGKKAASAVIAVQGKILSYLADHANQKKTLEEIAVGIGESQKIETIFKICQHLSANPDRRITRTPGSTPFESRYESIG